MEILLRAGECLKNASEEWCDDTSKNTGFAFKPAESAAAKLEAKIGKLRGDISASVSQIESMAAAVATGESELKDATSVRLTSMQARQILRMRSIRLRAPLVSCQRKWEILQRLRK